MEPLCVHFNNSSRESLLAPKALDRMLDNRKGNHKESEDDCLVKGGIDQGLSFKAATEAEEASDHDDFSENQCFDHRHPVVRVCDVVGREHESSIPRERGEDEREIDDIEPVLDQLATDLCLPASGVSFRTAHDV